MATFGIARHNINKSVGGIRFDQNIIDTSWDFRPSIGIVARDMQLYGLAIENMKGPLITAVREVMIPSIRQNFLADGRPPWEPLAPVTVNRFRHGASGPILYRTGKLEKAATSFNIWTITNTAATIRALPHSVWYGELHQAGFGTFGPFVQAAQASLGAGAGMQDVLREAFRLMDEARGGATQHRKVSIPQRKFIMFQDEDIDEIQEIFAEWLEFEARKVGRFRPGVGGL